jgi:tetratricopeptide (TPR) repeat protein
MFMSELQLATGMKFVILPFLFSMLVVSCNSGSEKPNDANYAEKSKDTGTSLVPVQNPSASTQNVVVSGQSPTAPVSSPAQGKVQDPVNPSRQTVKFHPSKKDPNDPTRNLLNAYAQNKVNSVVIPFRKGDDPNLKASQNFYFNGSRKAKEGDHRGAIEDFTKSLELVRNASVYMQRGYSYLLLQDYQSSLYDMNEAIKLAPVLDKAYFARAICRFEMQDFITAEEDLRKYMETDKTNALAFNYLAAIKFMQKNFKEALDNYNEVVKLDPAFPDIYTNRGMMRHNLGDLKGAIQDYDLAIKNDPSNSSAYNNKGAAELTLKEYEAALRDLNMAIRLKEDYADAYDNRGKVKLKLGNQEGACDDWQKAYSLGLEASRELIIKFCK